MISFENNEEPWTIFRVHFYFIFGSYRPEQKIIFREIWKFTWWRVEWKFHSSASISLSSSKFHKQRIIHSRFLSLKICLLQQMTPNWSFIWMTPWGKSGKLVGVLSLSIHERKNSYHHCPHRQLLIHWNRAWGRRILGLVKSPSFQSLFSWYNLAHPHWYSNPELLVAFWSCAFSEIRRKPDLSTYLLHKLSSRISPGIIIL